MLLNKDNLRDLRYWVDNIYGRTMVLFCIDVEAWERDNSIITEIGISVYDPLEQEDAMMPSINSFHIIPREHASYKNGRYVPDHSRFFAGNATHVMDLEDAIVFIELLIMKYFEEHPLPCCLVGHDLKGDVKWLNTLGISFPERHNRLDTQRLLSYSTGQKNSLTNCLRLLEIPHSHLHNAGNDAFYTLLLALKASDPVSRGRFSLDDDDLLDIVKPTRNKKGACPQIEVENIREMFDSSISDELSDGYSD